MNSNREAPGSGDWPGTLLAGLAWTIAVFLVAFGLGAVRVTLVVPAVGELLAVLLEAPVVLTVSWWLARWAVRRFRVPADVASRVLMGVTAFVFLMGLELAVAVLAFGETLDHYVARLGTTPGLVGLATQACYAAIPWAQRRFRHDGR